MPFKKGQSGNPNGSSQARIWKAAIERAIARRGKDGMQVIDRMADALINKCLAEDVPALREAGDRIDGKVAQVLQGDPDKPLFPNRIVIEVIDANDDAKG